MTVFGGGVDEFDVDLLGHPGLGGGKDRLPDDDGSLSGSHDTALDEEEIFVDFTVMRESTEWGDVLLDGVSLAHGVVGDSVDGSSTDSVDLFVEFSSGVVTELTASSDSPLDCRWMPGSDTGDLANTSMGASLQSSNSESLDDTLGSLTSGNANGVDALRVGEDLRDLDLLLELLVSEVDLVSDGTSVELDLHDVGLHLSEVELVDLGGADHADGGAVLLHALEVSLDGLWILVVLLEAVNVVLEGVLLGGVVVLVESSLHSSIDLLSPHGGQGTESSWGLNVSDHTDDLHGWALNDGGGVNDILLDDLLTLTTLLELDDVGHAGLVAHEGSEVDWLGLVVLWPVSNATSVVLSSSLWHVSERALSWVLELSVRHSAI